ncbi:MAG: HD domain-containing protein, partial [Candidatus Cloacimonadaceae bacterium]|nr:HD domain-containing protein [Candidatus Cloacimonadaceae bacterium]
MLTIPMSTATGRIIGVHQLINAMDSSSAVVPFDEGYIPLIQHFANSAAIALERAEMTRDIILRMIKMAELRDPKETGAHVNRVGAYSAELYEVWARKHKIPEAELKYHKDLLRIAAMLHDVGKVGISDTVLKKPGKLDFEEYEIIKTHPRIGAKLFTNQQSDLDAMSLDIALGHHERWDGKGYPGFIDVHSGLPLPDKTTAEGKALGKSGTGISLWARIVALADVYDALSSRRCYKEPWTEEMVLSELQNCAGTNFDPELTELFLSISDQMNSIRNNYPDTEENQ